MSAPTPVFRATVRPGPTLKAYDRAALGAWLSALVGEEVDLVVRKHESPRSIQQNRLWFGEVIRGFLQQHFQWEPGESVIFEGREIQHPVEFFHYYFVALWGGSTEIDGVWVPNEHSSKLTTARFSDLIEWAVRYIAKRWGHHIQLPGDWIAKEGAA